jgi:hypothetical protein
MVTKKELEQRVHDLELESARLNGIIEELRRQPMTIPPVTYPPPYINPSPLPTSPTYPTAPGWPWYPQIWCGDVTPQTSGGTSVPDTTVTWL